MAEAAVAEVSAGGGCGATAAAALPVGSDPPEDKSCVPPDPGRVRVGGSGYNVRAGADPTALTLVLPLSR